MINDVMKPLAVYNLQLRLHPNGNLSKYHKLLTFTYIGNNPPIGLVDTEYVLITPSIL